MKRLHVAAAFAALLALSGCDRIVDNDRQSRVAEADKKAAASDFRGAIRLYEAALDGTAKTADLHQKLAVIYDEKLKSPMDEMHHFDRYLELAPNGRFSKEAKAYKKEGELKLLTSISKASFISQEEAVRIKNENLALRKSLVELRAQKAPPVAATVSPAGKADAGRKPIPKGGRTHTVAPGETLASIAVKYYKSKARWKDIQDANFYSLDGTAKIKPGQELYIP
jgi:LysM repeat protein